MEPARPGAFLSYATEDDRLDGGNILRLAERLANEYSLLTGQDLNLFIDRSSVKWGDEWRQRIDTALAETTFFIPIVTPRYFSRPECRKEAIAFHSGAQSLGVGELLLPILYSPVANFTDGNPDEVIALLSRYQYVDWSENRLTDPQSASYRRALHELAQRLASVAQATAERKLSEERGDVQQAAEGDGGLFDILNSINSILPDWQEALDSYEVNYAQFQATWELYGPRLSKLERSGGMASARFSLMQRVATEELPLARRFREDATTYARTCVDLNPLVMQVVRIIEANPDLVDTVTSLKEKFQRAEKHIEAGKERRKRGAVTAYEWARRRAHLSRLVKELAEIYAVAEAGAREGDALVSQWVRELDRVIVNSIQAKLQEVADFPNSQEDPTERNSALHE